MKYNFLFSPFSRNTVECNDERVIVHKLAISVVINRYDNEHCESYSTQYYLLEIQQMNSDAFYPVEIIAVS